MPREGGASSTPRLFGSITTVSGILDRPIKSGDDSECVVGTIAILDIRQKKGRDRSRPFVFDDVIRDAYFASARLGGVAGHDLISVS